MPRSCPDCLYPLSECDCVDDDGLISLNPPPPVPYDGPVRDADGENDDGAA